MSTRIDAAQTPGRAGTRLESSDARQRALTVARWLAVFTVLYNIAEGVVAVWAGAAADSVALIGFGVDSGIESAAALIVWRRVQVEVARGAGLAADDSERRAQRWVGVTFLALAAYVTADAAWSLWGHPAEPSRLGIAVASVSLIVMPPLALWKLRVAEELRSAALRAEGKETVACIYLSFCLVLGLGATHAFGWAWADSVAALAMVPWLVKEGLEGVRGEECCHA